MISTAGAPTAYMALVVVDATPNKFMRRYLHHSRLRYKCIQVFIFFQVQYMIGTPYSHCLCPSLAHSLQLTFPAANAMYTQGLNPLLGIYRITEVPSRGKANRR